MELAIVIVGSASNSGICSRVYKILEKQGVLNAGGIKYMTKELSPLEALQDLSKLVFIYGRVQQYQIIEKSLKALEIIKEKERTITEKERTIQILMNKC